MKVKILDPSLGAGAGDGVYGGMTKVRWGEVVEAQNSEKDPRAVLVKGSEFIAIGGDTEAFLPDVTYIWGTFEEV